MNGRFAPKAAVRILDYSMNEVKHPDLPGRATIANCGYAASVLAGASLLDREIGEEKGTLSRELRKHKKPNEIRLRQRAGFCFVARLAYRISGFRNARVPGHPNS